MSRIVWCNGTLGPEEDARISPFDHGLLTGDGVFETLRVYGGEAFAWRRHLERLAHSAGGLGLTVPDSAVVKEAADAVLAANGLTEARLRITLTGGPSPLGSERGAAEPTVVISAMPLAPVPETVAVATVEWARNERGALAGLKTISYAENVRALAVAAQKGAGEAIFGNTRGELCEGTGTNVFVVSGGRLLTPPASSGCLLGVTRALILVAAERVGVEAAEEAMPLSALAEADEAFISSTTREVQAIATVDGTALPPAPGPVTRRLGKAFSELVAEDMDP